MLAAGAGSASLYERPLTDASFIQAVDSLRLRAYALADALLVTPDDAGELPTGTV